MMPDIFTVKDQKVPLTYKKNSRAKRLSLKFSQREKVLVVTLPPRVIHSQVKAFLNRCEPWVERQLAAVSESLTIQPGATRDVYLFRSDIITLHLVENFKYPFVWRTIR